MHETGCCWIHPYFGQNHVEHVEQLWLKSAKRRDINQISTPGSPRTWQSVNIFHIRFVWTNAVLGTPFFANLYLRTPGSFCTRGVTTVITAAAAAHSMNERQLTQLGWWMITIIGYQTKQLRGFWITLNLVTSKQVIERFSLIALLFSLVLFLFSTLSSNSRIHSTFSYDDMLQERPYIFTNLNSGQRIKKRSASRIQKRANRAAPARP